MRNIEKRNLNRSLLKAIAILKSFSPEESELGATEIARKNNISLTTAHRILSTLTKGGLLQQDKTSAKYSIGCDLYVLGNLYLGTATMLKVSEPVMKVLNDLTGEAISLSILDEKGYVTIVLREETKFPLRIGAHIGVSSPAYATARGKALLSELTDAEIDRLFSRDALKPLTKKTISTKTKLKMELEQVRRSGIAMSEGESIEGADGIASIIREASGKAIGSIAISLPSVRMNRRKRNEYSELIKRAANFICYQMGYQNAFPAIRNIDEIRSWWQKKMQN